MNILPLTLLDSIVVIANTSDQRVPNRRALQSITMASCRSPYIMQRIECPPQMIPTCLHADVLYAVVRPRLWGFAVWRGVTPSPPPSSAPVAGRWSVRARRNSLADACRKPPLSATCAFRIRRCVHLDKLAALNLTSFISSNLPRSTAHVPAASREMFYTCAKPYPAYVSRYIVIGYNTWPMPLINLSASLFRGDGQIMRPDYALHSTRFVRF